jgi:plasmid maintenance system antidote protein VapI
MPLPWTRDTIMSVREMLERHWDVSEMAAKLHLDPYTVQSIVDFLNNVLT